MRISDWSSDVCSSDLVIHAQNALDAEGGGRLRGDALRVAQHRNEIGLGCLDEVDLAVDQRRLGGLLVGLDDPFDPVRLGDLATGRSAGRFLAWNVVCILDIDRKSVVEGKGG